MPSPPPPVPVWSSCSPPSSRPPATTSRTSPSRPAGKRRVVRVVVDKDGGSTLDDIAEVSRAVSDLLDEAEDQEPELLGGAYVLEVSSPGVDRRLTLPRHWRRNAGRLVEATLADGAHGHRSGARRPTTLEVILDVDGTEQQLLLAQITSGAVQVEFSRRDADGRRRRRVKIDMTVLRSLEREKDIKLDLVVEAIESALLTAYRHTEGSSPHARVVLDRKTGEIAVHGPGAGRGRQRRCRSTTTPPRTSAGSPR